jgi:hypothetical protein
VQERVRSRRNKRALAGLPLFEQAEEQETKASPQSVPPAAEQVSAREPPRPTA